MEDMTIVYIADCDTQTLIKKIKEIRELHQSGHSKIIIADKRYYVLKLNEMSKELDLKKIDFIDLDTKKDINQQIAKRCRGEDHIIFD